MNKTFCLVLLAAGIVLIILGINAANSLGSDFSRLFRGMPNDKSVWLLLAGLIATVVGAQGLLRSAKSG